MKLLLGLALLCFAATALNLNAPAINWNIIRKVNSNPKSTWEAGPNSRFRGLKMADAQVLCGVVKDPTINLPVKTYPEDMKEDLPTAFDSRVQWGSICNSTYEIRDQSACGSCWAFGAVEAMTDRICINTTGAKTPHLSAEDMNSCCTSCGAGCGGGDPGAAWNYWVSNGLVDGGNYSFGGCAPYSLPPCEHHINGSHYPHCPSQEYNTPNCPTNCQNGADWQSSTWMGATAYNVQSVQNIQVEIQTYGPVEAAFTVYEDFLQYKSGVYYYQSGAELGGHAVKILGWGVWTDGTPYWTVANSWNSDWGNGGYFLIRRGTDECGIEDDIVAGLPA